MPYNDTWSAVNMKWDQKADLQLLCLNLANQLGFKLTLGAAVTIARRMLVDGATIDELREEHETSECRWRSGNAAYTGYARHRRKDQLETNSERPNMA